MVKVYVPVNLDLVKLIADNPIAGIKNVHIDKLAFIIHLLSEIPSYNKELSEHDWIPLNAQLLRTWIGKDYTTMLQYLIETGVIETDNHFIVGEKSRGYRLTEKYQSELIPFEISCFILRKKILNQQRKMNGKVSKSKRKVKVGVINKNDRQYGYKVAEQWYNTGLLEIDYVLAHAYNSLVYQEKLTDRNKCDYKRIKNRMVSKSPYTQYTAGFYSIEKMKNQIFNCHKDNNVHRMHSTLTNMKKEIRNYITFNGEEMVSIDLSNSQPYLFLLLVNPKFWSDEESDLLKSSQIFSNSQSLHSYIFSSNSLFTYYITLLNTHEMQSSKGFQEIQKYVELVTSGNFYKDFHKMVSEIPGFENVTLGEIKPIVFTTFFTDNRFVGQEDAAAKRLFKAAFPEIYHLQATIKKKGANKLPIALQRIESHIMYHRIIPRISSERPDVPLFPIHDSIATTASNKEYVATVMKEEIEKAVGYPCNLKYEYWQPIK